MLKGFAITPPVVGRISIGRMVERNGKRLPEKDDQFTITTQIQNQAGWILHPVDAALREQADNGKLRSIPITLMFNDPDLNLRAEYTFFDRTSGRPVCSGNGESCQRRTAQGLERLPCPSPSLCEFGANGLCKPYGRLYVRIGEEDELNSFIFRTTGFNSIRTLAARLRYYHAVSGGYLSTLPLELRLRGKSTTLSRRTPIYYVDITLREGYTLEIAVQEAKAKAVALEAAGVEQAALDQCAHEGLANGAFEADDEEEVFVEEFYRGDGEVAKNAAEAVVAPKASNNTAYSAPRNGRERQITSNEALKEKLGV